MLCNTLGFQNNFSRGDWHIAWAAARARRVGSLLLLVVVGFGCGSFEADAEAVAYPLRDYPMAVCLDGSPGSYYLQKGSGDGRSRFHIFFEGGGFCGSHPECAERAAGYLGSTAGDPPSKVLDDHPFFSRSKEESPLLWNWNHVLVRYCDGAYFSGARADPQLVESAPVFYRGSYITGAVLEDLARSLGMQSATDVVFSGCSAGAIRVFAHLDALRGLLPPEARVSGFPDSGFYLDRPIFTPLKRFVVRGDGQNATGLLNEACVKDNAGTEERCLIGNVALPYLETPLFAWQSRYDSDQQSCEMTQACAKSEACVRAYGANLTEEMHRTLLAKPTLGAFLDSCSRHCAADALPRDDARKMNPMQAFAAWYANSDSHFYRQEAPFPCSECCAASEGVLLT